MSVEKFGVTLHVKCELVLPNCVCVDSQSPGLNQSLMSHTCSHASLTTNMSMRGVIDESHLKTTL